ncbi:hypothetical protein Nepgr_029671 [Nepenthes gracilis]|uniref:Uncharacterized protein n=1 Tax=Nepenthes gracilis TaxID=150966 RepID=A0AAD3TCW0_NEPGR|nr:hypothetical protein Nepgr_029671 [Nepenthes gracilis]
MHHTTRDEIFTLDSFCGKKGGSFLPGLHSTLFSERHAFALTCFHRFISSTSLLWDDMAAKRCQASAAASTTSEVTAAKEVAQSPLVLTSLLSQMLQRRCSRILQLTSLLLPSSLCQLLKRFFSKCIIQEADTPAQSTNEKAFLEPFAPVVTTLFEPGAVVEAYSPSSVHSPLG